MKRASAGFWPQRLTADGTIWISSMPRNLQKEDPDNSQSIGIKNMSNIIGFSKAAFGEERISMSNQGTDCFLELLEMAAAENDMTDNQRNLICFLKDRREENLAAPGTVSFDIDEMPWNKDTLSEDAAYMMEIIEKAKTVEVVGKLDYRPDFRIVSPWLDQFSSMIWKLDKDYLYGTEEKEQSSDR